MKRSLFIIGIFSIIVALLVSTLVASSIFTSLNKKVRVVEKKATSFTYVLLGYGGGKHEGTFLTDTILVAHIDTLLKQTLLISIPRDLWVLIPTKSGKPFYRKINSIYQLGLFPSDLPDLDNTQSLLIHTLNTITGYSIDGFAAVNFAAFTRAIDLIGGIDVDIEKSFTDTQYPVEGKEKDTCGKSEEELKELTNPEKKATASPELNFPCRYETVAFMAGITHLSGSATLRYARSRHAVEDGGDFNRARRQQQVLTALRAKILSPYFISRIPFLYAELKDSIHTSIVLKDIHQFLKLIPAAKKYTIKQVVIDDHNVLKASTSPDGQFILIPRRGVNKYHDIKKLLYISPSKRVK